MTMAVCLPVIPGPAGHSFVSRCDYRSQLLSNPSPGKSRSGPYMCFTDGTRGESEPPQPPPPRSPALRVCLALLPGSSPMRFRSWETARDKIGRSCVCAFPKRDGSGCASFRGTLRVAGSGACCEVPGIPYRAPRLFIVPQALGLPPQERYLPQAAQPARRPAPQQPTHLPKSPSSLLQKGREDKSLHPFGCSSAPLPQKQPLSPF